MAAYAARSKLSHSLCEKFRSAVQSFDNVQQCSAQTYPAGDLATRDDWSIGAQDRLTLQIVDSGSESRVGYLSRSRQRGPGSERSYLAGWGYGCAGCTCGLSIRIGFPSSQAAMSSTTSR